MLGTLYAKYSFNPQNMINVWLATLYGCWNWDSESLCHLPELTYLGSGGSGIWMTYICLLEHLLLSTITDFLGFILNV